MEWNKMEAIEGHDTWYAPMSDPEIELKKILVYDGDKNECGSWNLIQLVS